MKDKPGVSKCVNHREALGFWLNALGLTGEGAEIGVAAGDFANTVLSQWKGRVYHMIDPWAKQDGEIYRENTNNDAPFDEWLEKCRHIASQDSRVQIHRMLSEQAVKEFKNNQLDWCYLDGNHSYRAVMDDMDAWWPKVRSGGLFAGHDFKNQTDGGAWIEVDKAVLRWTQEHNVPFYVSPCSSWFIHKP